MNPESLMPAFRNGMAGFLIAVTSVIVPLIAVTYEHRTSPTREASQSRDRVEISSQLVQRRAGNVYGSAHSFDD